MSPTSLFDVPIIEEEEETIDGDGTCSTFCFGAVIPLERAGP